MHVLIHSTRLLGKNILDGHLEAWGASTLNIAYLSHMERKKGDRPSALSSSRVRRTTLRQAAHPNSQLMLLMQSSQF
jgi:hypothetical protein